MPPKKSTSDMPEPTGKDSLFTGPPWSKPLEVKVTFPSHDAPANAHIPSILEVYGPYILPMLALDAGRDPVIEQKLEKLMTRLMTDVCNLGSYLTDYLRNRSAACISLVKLLEKLPKDQKQDDIKTEKTG